MKEQIVKQLGLIARIIVVSLIVIAVSFGLPAEPPLYKQGDSPWGSEKLGSATELTITEQGCAVCAVAMAAKGAGKKEADPLHLIKWRDPADNWITNPDGMLVWSRVDDYAAGYLGSDQSCGLTDQAIKQAIDENHYVILKMLLTQDVNKNGIKDDYHFILAWSYDANGIKVKDSSHGDQLLSSDKYSGSPLVAHKFKVANGGNGGDSPPPPPDDTRASLAECSLTNQGEGYYPISVTCEDRTGQAKGVRSIKVILHMGYHEPQVWLDLGKHFSPNNPNGQVPHFSDTLSLALGCYF